MTGSVQVEGVLAVVGARMRGRPLVLGEPAERCLPRPAPLWWGTSQVGIASRAWRDGQLVRWAGRLDDPDASAEFLAAPVESWRVPTVPAGLEHILRAVREIREGRLVGLPWVSGSQSTRAGATLVEGWKVERVDLSPAGAQPWPEVELHVVDAPPRRTLRR